MAATPGPANDYAYCEPIHASTSSYTHIRLLGDEGLRLEGGAPDTTLCGIGLHNGWDIRASVTDFSVTTGLEAEGNPVCPRCAVAWRQAVDA
jgi:hypothetical protein